MWTGLFSSRLAVLGTAACLCVVSGCKNPRYCAGNPDDDCVQMWDAGSDTPTRCTSSDECTPPAAVCDVAGTKVCVPCTSDQPSACSGTAPSCGPDHTCQACAAHTDCTASSACLPDGSCAAESLVAYVDPGGTDNTGCSLAMPCTEVAKAIATGRAYVKLTGTTNEQVSLDNNNVTFLADPGAKLTDTSNGILLRIDGTSQVAIYDLEISGASGAGNSGVSMQPGNTASVSLTRVKVLDNTGNGIAATGGSLTVTRSTISGNTSGGISITGAQFDLTNNIIVKNGSVTSAFGGILVSQIGSGAHNLDFNTIAANGGASGTTTGVVCSLVTQAKTFSNNIVYGNQVSGGGTQVGGSNCSWAYSDIGPDTVSGAGNVNWDPVFADIAQNNFHLRAGSPVKDVADPAATLGADFDGDARPQGAGRDIGADEVP